MWVCMWALKELVLHTPQVYDSPIYNLHWFYDWGLTTLVQNPRTGVLDVGHKPFGPQGKVPFRSLMTVGHSAWSGVFGKGVPLPLLPISVRPFYPLLWRCCSSSIQDFLWGNYSICSCGFVISIGEEFRTFLHCHLV